MTIINVNKYVYTNFSYEVFTMKKLLAVVLSVMMVVALGFSTSVVAFAAQDVLSVNSQQTTQKKVKPSVTVNGNTTTEVEIEVDEQDPNKIVFTYTGDGEIQGWNFYDGDGNLLVEGEDYTVVFDGNSAIVTVINPDIDEIIADADVDNGETPDEPTTEPTTDTTKPNKKPTSPDTGAIGATGLAVAGAGVAILAAMKRKSDAE